MTGETERDVSGWTVDTYRIHNEAMRVADEKFQSERDRRYAEVATEREKALKIKETADLAALGLAREIQTYKDEKANELRSQIERERGSYVTKPELQGAIEKIEETLKPIISFVSQQQGRSSGLHAGWGVLLGAVGLVSTLLGGGMALYSLNRGGPSASPPQQVIYIPTTPSAVTPKGATP